jgi:hypothetical protein
MSGKLFIQIIILMFLFVVIKMGTMCMAKQYCPIMRKSRCASMAAKADLCPTCTAKVTDMSKKCGM